ncbi:MAG: protein kinase [Myxococcota bacterium]
MSRGSTFGPYEIVRPLGVGGMAETSVAVRRGPGGFEQTVCLKRVLAAYNEDARFVDMFLHEARLAARMRHNNVVQVYDFGQHEGSYYMALELVEGLDLRFLIAGLKKRGERVPLDIVGFVIYELLSALAYAHDLELDGKPAGLVHRDVTPSNVLISTHGEIKLADFGIAKATNTANATQTGSVKGKIPYMAPEQAMGQSVDRRTDLFAVGVMLYELLAGRRPFDGPTDTATLLNISRGQFVPLDEAAPEAPAALREVVATLLLSDAAARYQTAGDVLDAIVDFVPPPTTARKLGKIIAELREASRKRAVERAATEHADSGANPALAQGASSSGASSSGALSTGASSNRALSNGASSNDDAAQAPGTPPGASGTPPLGTQPPAHREQLAVPIPNTISLVKGQEPPSTGPAVVEVPTGAAPSTKSPVLLLAGGAAAALVVVAVFALVIVAMTGSTPEGDGTAVQQPGVAAPPAQAEGRDLQTAPPDASTEERDPAPDLAVEDPAVEDPAVEDPAEEDPAVEELAEGPAETPSEPADEESRMELEAAVDMDLAERSSGGRASRGSRRDRRPQDRVRAMPPPAIPSEPAMTMRQRGVRPASGNDFGL